jgi:hypothetical protein
MKNFVCDCEYVTEIPIKTVRNRNSVDKPRCKGAWLTLLNFFEIHHFMYGAHPRQFNTLRNVKAKREYTKVCEITGLEHYAKNVNARILICKP